MPFPGNWIQGPNVDITLGGTNDVGRWDRNPGVPTDTTDMLADPWGQPYDSYPSALAFSGSRLEGGLLASQVGRYIPVVTRRTATLAYPNVDPGSWPEGAIGIEYEPGGGSYAGAYHVQVSYQLNGDQSEAILTLVDSRLFQATEWPAGASIAAGDFPNTAEWTSWITRHSGNVPATDVGLGLTNVEWDQAGPDVAVFALPAWAVNNTEPGIVGLYTYHVTTPVIRRAYTPPRHRFIFPFKGNWNARQAQAATGNSGGWPSRYGPNAGHTGGWPARYGRPGI